MLITEEVIRKIADLAKLKFTDDEVQFYIKELQKILGSMNELNDLDTEGVLPLVNPIYDHPEYFTDGVNWRKDEEASSEDVYTLADVLKNAPDSHQGQIKVDVVIED